MRQPGDHPCPEERGPQRPYQGWGSGSSAKSRRVWQSKSTIPTSRGRSPSRARGPPFWTTASGGVEQAGDHKEHSKRIHQCRRRPFASIDPAAKLPMAAPRRQRRPPCAGDQDAQPSMPEDTTPATGRGATHEGIDALGHLDAPHRSPATTEKGMNERTATTAASTTTSAIDVPSSGAPPRRLTSRSSPTGIRAWPTSRDWML